MLFMLLYYAVIVKWEICSIYNSLIECVESAKKQRFFCFLL